VKRKKTLPSTVVTTPASSPSSSPSPEVSGFSGSVVYQLPKPSLKPVVSVMSGMPSSSVSVGSISSEIVRKTSGRSSAVETEKYWPPVAVAILVSRALSTLLPRPMV